METHQANFIKVRVLAKRRNCHKLLGRSSGLDFGNPTYHRIERRYL